MTTPQEPDFPPGHPARGDYDPNSPVAKEWMRVHSSPLGERDFPVDSPFAVDTKGNLNREVVVNGINPAQPQLEQFTGRTPAVAAAVKAQQAALSAAAKPTPVRPPVIAPPPPKNPGSTVKPAGQPG